MKYKYLDTVGKGTLFDEQELADKPRLFPGDNTTTDIVATHKLRDQILIDRFKTFGEILVNGMAEPRKIGGEMIIIAREAEEIEKEVGFKYGEGK